MRELIQWQIDQRDVNRCDCHMYSPCGCYNSDLLAWSFVDEYESGKTGVECLACGATWTSFDDDDT